MLKTSLLGIESKAFINDDSFKRLAEFTAILKDVMVRAEGDVVGISGIY